MSELIDKLIARQRAGDRDAARTLLLMSYAAPGRKTKGKGRKPRAHPTESDEQQALFSWLRSERPELHAFHVPNGGHRSDSEAARFKREGVVAGIPDILITSPCPPFVGLAIEMKRVGGKGATALQLVWLANLRDDGWRAQVCHGYDEARALICEAYGG